MKRLFPYILCGLLSLSCHSNTKSESPLPRPVSKGEAATAPDTILRHTLYTAADSAKVVELLKATVTGNDVLFYARQFKGIPYAASTLERNDPEQLVVNLTGLDCTTLVETSLALARTHRQGGKTFEAFCHNLETLRYRGGMMDGYLSRLHYFSWWWHDNANRGNIGEVILPTSLTAPVNVDNHYMSQHPDKYKFLRLHPEWVDSIKAMEQAANGIDGRYLPQDNVKLTRAKLKAIEDGDLVAIVTRKDGIDYSHLGLAVWGKDGQLHLLNASSIHKKVVEEPKTLFRYLQEHPSSIGIRLWRLQ